MKPCRRQACNRIVLRNPYDTDLSYDLKVYCSGQCKRLAQKEDIIVLEDEKKQKKKERDRKRRAIERERQRNLDKEMRLNRNTKTFKDNLKDDLISLYLRGAL